MKLLNISVEEWLSNDYMVFSFMKGCINFSLKTTALGALPEMRRQELQVTVANRIFLF